jgi:uncharacterized protein (TIGR02145 family)
MKNSILFFAGVALLTLTTQAQTVTDIDGNVYNTVTIGTQVWFKENLKTTKYNDNVTIPNVTDNTAWSKLTTGAYCDYKNTPSNSSVYGRLYNWYSVKTNKLCPTGWHVPSNDEWLALATHLGGLEITGGKLKETGTTHWISPNTGATNETGFSALPGGYRYNVGDYGYIGLESHWWSTTGYGINEVFHFVLTNTANWMGRGREVWETGYCVRCLRDLATQTNKIEDKLKIEIYPNPANNLLIVKNLGQEKSNLIIYNIVGKQLLLCELIKGSNEIDISSLLNGIYVIQTSSLSGTIQQKLIKQ